MERARLKQGLSKSALARAAGLNQVTVIEATNGRRLLGPSQLQKLAAALGWTGDPAGLLAEVTDDAVR
ncbi:MAG: helix-turn-helix transcriptional regulator [Coriobacteriia bacterium]|nr:helix-turn-helix transcriptional regulator [Coriobacteriia bacterium]